MDNGRILYKCYQLQIFKSNWIIVEENLSEVMFLRGLLQVDLLQVGYY